MIVRSWRNSSNRAGLTENQGEPRPAETADHIQQRMSITVEQARVSQKALGLTSGIVLTQVHVHSLSALG